MDGSEKETCIEIKKKQFLGDKTLQCFDVPEGVREIGEWAFSGCRELKRISLPCSVERIGRDAFQGCDLLGEAYLRIEMPQYGNGAAAGSNACEGMTSEQAGLMALALRFFPEAAMIIKAWCKGSAEWLTAWDEACIKYLDSPETSGFQPFWAGGEEDYEEDESKLEEHCRGRRLVKAEMIFKRLAVMEEREDWIGEGTGKRSFYETRLRDNDMALEYLKRITDRPGMAVTIYEKAGMLTQEKIRKVLDELPEEAVELRAVLLNRVSGDGNCLAGIEEMMLE